MILAAVSLIALLLSIVTGSCPCGGKPEPSDTTSRLICNNMNSILDGITGKSVSQCHHVIIRNGQSCEVNEKYDPKHDKSILHSKGRDYQCYRIFQPGFYDGKCYDNELFCAYNVQCAPNQMLFYQISKHDIEDPTRSKQCLDILSIERHSFPNQKFSTCGRVGINGATFETHNVIQTGYDIGSLRVTFRSNKRCSANGYYLWVNCVDDDGPGHCPGRRKKLGRGIIKVPFRGTLTYSRRTLTVRAPNGARRYTARNIVLLRVGYDGSNRVRNYKSFSKPLVLHGEGHLNAQHSCRRSGHYKFCVAYYKFIGVPHEYRVTKSELKDVQKLLKASVRRFKGKGDYSIVSKKRNGIFKTNQIKNKFHFAAAGPPSNFLQRLPLTALAHKLKRSCRAITRSVGHFYLQKVL